MTGYLTSLLGLCGGKKMGAKVHMTAVYRAVLEYHWNTIDNCAALGKSRICISFEQFKQALYASELVSDPRSVKTKWETAVAQGVLEEIRKGRSADLVIPQLKLKAAVNPFARTHTDTHTILNTPIDEVL